MTFSQVQRNDVADALDYIEETRPVLLPTLYAVIVDWYRMRADVRDAEEILR